MKTLNSGNIQRATKSFLDQQRSEVTGLIESYDGSSRYAYDSAKGEYQIGTKEYLENQCFVYDGALAAIAYAVASDFNSAKAILKTFEHNFHYVKGDRIGLFNAYRTDAYADTSRLLAMGIDGDRMHAGPNIWVGFAAYHYTMLSGNTEFFPFFLEIIKWVMHRIPHDTLANRARAGIAMGSGWGPLWQEIYSTEHNIDYFAILNLLRSHFKDAELQAAIKASDLRYEAICQEQDAVLLWLLEKVFDVSECRFNVGVNQAGIDKVRALDTTTFALLGIGPICLNAKGINTEILIRNTEQHLQVLVDIAGKKISGFDFTDQEGHGNKRPEVIWIEGTYQMALSYREMAKFYKSNQDTKTATVWHRKADRLINQTERLIELLGADKKIPPYTSAKPRPTEVFKTFKEDWEIQRGDNSAAVKSVASAVWRLLAVENFNPMSSHGNISTKNKFSVNCL